jgi:cell division protein ZapA
MAETMNPPEADQLEAPQSISVDIYDQIYHLRGTDTAYIDSLARSVDTKMRAVSAHGNTVDSLRVAVLAALNIADELCTARQRLDSVSGSQHSTRSRATTLSDMLDEVLEDRKVG